MGFKGQNMGSDPEFGQNLRFKFLQYLKKLYQKVRKNASKVFLECFPLAQSTISTSKIMFEVFWGRNFIHQAQKWPKKANFGPFMGPPGQGQKF